MKSPEQLVKEAHAKHRTPIAYKGGGGYDNCAFIKIPRTGTNSINMILKQSMGHRTALEWMHKYPDQWPDLFTFAIVRNPYTRFVSACHHVGTDVNKQVPTDDIIFKPQHLFIYDSDELLVDKVYRFEQWDKTWDDIAKRIGCDQTPQHLHKTPGTKQVLSNKSKARLAKYYTEDFERFGYDR